MADGRHLGKIVKLLHPSCLETQFNPLDRFDRSKLEILEIQDGSHRHLEKSKNSHILAAFDRS